MIVLRSEKGSALTYEEMDENFLHALKELEDGNWRIFVNGDDLRFEYANNIVTVFTPDGVSFADSDANIINANTVNTVTLNSSDVNTSTLNVSSILDPSNGNTVSINGIVPAIANTSNSIAGTNNTQFLTPLRLREALNAGGSPPVYACRAWVNFQGSGTVTIRGSGNVSSITDNGTGNYRVNFTTAMPDTNYATIATQGGATVGGDQRTTIYSANPNTSFVDIGCIFANVTYTDPLYVQVAIFR